MLIIKPVISRHSRRDGKRSVSIQVNITRTDRIWINTGVQVPDENWNEKGFVEGLKNARDLNLVIEKCRSRVDDIIIRYRLQNRRLTGNMLKREYSEPGLTQDFYVYAKEYMQKKRTIHSPNTEKSMQSVLNKLRKFRPVLQFADIDENLIEELRKYLRKENNNPNTIAKNMAWLKAIINNAIKEKIIDHNPFRGIRLNRQKPDRPFLTIDELRKLWDFYNRGIFPQNHQMLCRYFLFSCFTGLRLGDVKKIKLSDIVSDILVLRPEKSKNTTGDLVKIPLISQAKRLISDADPNPNEPIFKSYSDQISNKHLKKMIDSIGIDKHLTFHSGRHTFASTYLQFNPGDVAALQKIMGHASIEHTMVYVHVTEETKKERMARIEEML